MIDPSVLAEILGRYSRKLLGDVTESAVSIAADAHPLLESIATDLLGRAFDDVTIARLSATLEQLLRELLGDDYPLVIDAQTIIIDDQRSTPTD